MGTELAATERWSWPLEGMTCSSCANRVDRTLNKLEAGKCDRQLCD